MRVIDGLVSTIIPVYNRAELLSQAVGSVLSQRYRQIEIIIIDDGSTDRTSVVAAEMAAAHPHIIRVVHQKNAGPGCARETGRLVARGEFVQYLDSDDLLLPAKFSAQVAALRRYPECEIAYGVTELIDENGQVLVSPYKLSGMQLHELFPALLVDRWWNTHTPLYRQSLCDAIGPWSNYRMAEDWEYDARAGALRAKLAYCPVVVSRHRQHCQRRLTGGGLDRDKILAFAHLISSLHKCACNAGVECGTPEMRHFSRWAFLVARQAGAAGLPTEAEECFFLARQAAGPKRGAGGDFRIYSLLAHTLGWANAGKLSGHVGRVRRASGSDTLKQFWMKE